MTAGEKSFLVGDETAELLLSYTVLLVQRGSADRVEVAAFELVGGRSTRIELLLGAALALTSEEMETGLPEPANAKADAYLRSGRDRLEAQDNYPPEEIAGASVWNALPE